MDNIGQNQSHHSDLKFSIDLFKPLVKNQSPYVNGNLLTRVKNSDRMEIIDKSSSPLLSVVVSCKAVKKILSQHLYFLHRQNLSQELWQVVFIFREAGLSQSVHPLIKKHFPLSQVFCLKEGQAIYQMRNFAFDLINSPYLYFIDEDVILEDSTFLSRLIETHKRHPEFSVLGGAYLDHPESSFWGNCYNWLVRLWVKARKTNQGQDVMPAGNLSVKAHETFKARFYSPHGFGAEELYFFKTLHQEGLKSYVDEALNVSHLAQHTFKDFIQRAWNHGKSEPKQKSADKRLFFKEPAGFLIKIMALFYLLLVRFSSIWNQFKTFVSKMA